MVRFVYPSTSEGCETQIHARAFGKPQSNFAMELGLTCQQSAPEPAPNPNVSTTTVGQTGKDLKNI